MQILLYIWEILLVLFPLSIIVCAVIAAVRYRKTDKSDEPALAERKKFTKSLLLPSVMLLITLAGSLMGRILNLIFLGISRQ